MTYRAARAYKMKWLRHGSARWIVCYSFSNPDRLVDGVFVPGTTFTMRAAAYRRKKQS